MNVLKIALILGVISGFLLLIFQVLSNVFTHTLSFKLTGQIFEAVLVAAGIAVITDLSKFTRTTTLRNSLLFIGSSF